MSQWPTHSREATVPQTLVGRRAHRVAIRVTEPAMTRATFRLVPLLGGLAALVATLHAQQPNPPESARSTDPFRFRSGVELINVTATVYDASGRFVPGLRQDDFSVFEDNQPVEVTHFSAERVPVSLGVALDTSGSMAGEKIRQAEAALNRFAYELLDKDDEMFLYRFSNYATLLQGWTTDRELIGRALGRITPNGGTALYDAVQEAIPLAAHGRFQKKALLIISDGNDTSSRAEMRGVKQQIRESEVLVYAIGIDGESEPVRRAAPMPPPRVPPFPIPQPFPPVGGRRFPLRGLAPQFGGQWGKGRWSSAGDDRVNVAVLRDMTDDSGGRTELIRSARDLEPATVGIADELSKQYYLGYQSAGKRDGKWHSIRVELKNGTYRVRARRGYTAN
jgi:Ca-activated chloride channel family protein